MLVLEPVGLNTQTDPEKTCEIVTGPSDPAQDTVRPTIPAVISMAEVPSPTCPAAVEVPPPTPLTVVGNSSNPAEKVETCASRRQKRAEGFYVKGTVMGIDVLFCVDTGASSTILSSKVYQKIPPDDRPPLRPALPHSTADGSAMKCMGRAEFPIRMGKLELVVTLTIAEITDDVLLGADLMHDGEEQPFDLLISEQRISWKGVSIPLTIASSPGSTRHIYAVDHYVIPGMSEMVVDVYVDRGIDDEGDNSVLIEPSSKVAESLRLAMPMCLVNVQNNTTVKVRLLNPFHESQSIKQDMVLGTARQYASTVESLLETEGGDDNDFSEVRRLSSVKHSIKRSNFTARTVDIDSAAKILTIPGHLKELYAETTVGLSKANCVDIAKLLIEFQDVFSTSNTDLGLTHLGEHAIDTGDANPLKQPPRRTPIAFEGEDKAALNKLQQQGSIRPSSSPWASPIVLVRKKDGSVRPCVDYRRLNSVTKPDAFPLPRTEDCLDAMAGSVLFSTLDITSAYNQVPVKAEDIPKTAFVTKYGLFEYTTMPFGLSNAPATFQRIIELALRGLQWTSCLIYLDDVIIFGKNIEEHLARLWAVLNRLRLAGLKLSPKKCQFPQPRVKFLGHVVSSTGVEPNADNVAKLARWSQPKTVKDVRSFLGLASYYRRFIPGFSKIAHPLTQLTHINHPFVWSKECQEAMESLKASLLGPEIMGYPRSDCPFILDTDACDISIGCVLSQVQDGRERVIAYASRVLSKSERNYCATDRELLAVVYFIKNFRHYLLGNEFTVRTDHQALKWLFSLKDPKDRVARWIETLSEFHFDVEYRQGTKHGNADGMSRCPNPHDCHCPETEERSLACGPCTKCKKRSGEQADTVPSSDTFLYEIKRNTPVATKPLEKGILSLLFLWVALVIGWIKKTYHHTREQSKSLVGFGRAEGPVGYNNLSSRDTPRNMKSKWWASTFGWDGYCRKVQTRNNGKRPTRDPSPLPVTPNQPTNRKEPPGWSAGYTLGAARNKQLEDPDIGPILKWITSGSRPFGAEVCASSPATRHYWNCWDRLEIHDNVLFRRFVRRDQTGNHRQLIVPHALQHEVITQLHKPPMSGHLGKKKTRERALQQYYWFGIRTDINQYVACCDICEANKAPPKTPRAPLGDMRVGAPMDRLATDILGPFPTTDRGNRFVLIVTDYFTNWVEILPVPDQTAITCAQRILNEVISRFGCPLDLHSDQGANYRSTIFQELCKLLEIRKTRTSPRNPKCNGKVERFNKTLVRMIRAYLKGQQREWDLHLGCLAAAYRATPHETTGLTPNLLMLGREARLPAEIMFGNTSREGPITSYGEYVESLRNKMDHAHVVARQHLKSAAKRQSTHYDGKTMLNKYRPGDYVWYLHERRKIGECPKLLVKFI